MKKFQQSMSDLFPLLLRYIGLLGVVYETVIQKTDRPYLLMMFGAMMGLSTLAAVAMKPGNPAEEAAEHGESALPKLPSSRP